jgi:hypothetical protein
MPAGTAEDGDAIRTLDWRLTGSGDATDGAVFEADDGDIKLLTFGQQFWQDSWQQVYQTAAQVLKEDGSTITYKRITDRWFVYSGKTKSGDTYGSVAKIVKLEHAWRRLNGWSDDGFQVAPFPG